jgi:membrane protein
MRSVFNLAKQTVWNWSDDKALRLGAALAYYAVFSIPPLLLIVIGIIGLVYSDAGAKVEQQIGMLMGSDAARAMMTGVQQKGEGAGAVGTIVGVGILLLGASGVFGELQDAMNTIWKVKPRPGSTWMAMLRDRFLSFTMVLSIAFLLLVSLMVSAAVAAFGGYLSSSLPGGEALGHVLDIALSVTVTTFLFALIFKYVPDVKLTWKDVFTGAFATAILFSIGKWLIGLYLGQSSIGSAYGAAGSLVILLSWVYYSSLILFLGAEFTKVYATRYGSRIEVEENAVPEQSEPRQARGNIRYIR